jgi:hypothetical protein
VEANWNDHIPERPWNGPNDWDWWTGNKLATTHIKFLAALDFVLRVKDVRDVGADVVFEAVSTAEEFFPFALAQSSRSNSEKEQSQPK